LAGRGGFEYSITPVRLYTALSRHIVLTLAALAVCAVTAPDAQPPADPGLIVLNVAEVKRLFMLVTRRMLPEAHHLHWVWWRRRHQARARWFHHRARLRRQLLMA
jgi:hypothetical protein